VFVTKRDCAKAKLGWGERGNWAGGRKASTDRKKGERQPSGQWRPKKKLGIDKTSVGGEKKKKKMLVVRPKELWTKGECRETRQGEEGQPPLGKES